MPSFAILTDEPNELVAPYHDRMPVVIDDPERWLDPNTTLDDIAPLGPEAFVVRPVNRAVNKVSEKDIDAIEAPQQQEKPKARSKAMIPRVGWIRRLVPPGRAYAHAEPLSTAVLPRF